MNTTYVIHKEFDITIYDEDLAEAFAKAKESYGPREDDVAIDDYVDDLMFEEAINSNLKIYINGSACWDSLSDVEIYYSDDVYDFVFNYILDELIKAQKRVESGEIEYI